MKEVERRASTDWMHAFFFAFDEANMTVDLNAMLDLVEATYEPLLAGVDENSSGSASVAKMVLDTFAELRKVDDRLVKQFAMLFIMARERAAQVAVCSRCDRRRTDRMLRWLIERGIDSVRNSKFNEFNAESVVTRLVNDASTQYVLGRTDTQIDRDRTRAKASIVNHSKRTRLR